MASVDIFEAWKEYEKVAMHFNDLLMKIRTQGIAVVATLSTLIGIIGRTSDGSMNWQLLSLSFFTLSFIWLAIWVLDFSYYNRLLIGAVVALKRIEEKSKENETLDELQLSTTIEKAVASGLDKSDNLKGSRGRWFFYTIVMIWLLSISIFCFTQSLPVAELPITELQK